MHIAIRDKNQIREKALEYLLKEQASMRILQEKDLDQNFKYYNEETYSELVILFVFDNTNPNDDLQVLTKIIAKYPKAKILVLTNSYDGLLLNMLDKIGAAGIAHLDIKTKELVNLIQMSSAGYKTHPELKPLAKILNQLKKQEQQIIRLACRGLTRKEIASQLNMSESSIKRNISNILAHTGHKSLNALTLEAILEEVINPRLMLKPELLPDKQHERGIQYYHACDQ